MSVLARFVGGPLNGQERVLPNLQSPFLVRVGRPNEWDAMGAPTYDEHRYDLDSRDYEARQAEIDQGSPALFVHEDLENVGRLLAASLGNMISFEEAYERVAEAFELDYSAPTIGPPVDTGRVAHHPADVHGYGTPIFDEAGGASAEDLVPGIEAALREWDETKKEIEDDS